VVDDAAALVIFKQRKDANPWIVRDELQVGNECDFSRKVISALETVPDF